MAQPPPVGYARVYSVDPPMTITARLSDERPNVEQGFGGWDEVARPRRSPLTTWKGAPALHLTLPLLFDRFRTDESIERELSLLARMGQPTAADGEPPRLHVVARGGAIPFQGRRWVLNDLAYGDAEMNARGNRTRQQVTLSLVEYIEDVHLVERSAAARRRTKATTAKTKRGAGTKRITVRRSAKPHSVTGTRSVTAFSTSVDALSSGADDYGAGEDLLSIAARELGDASRWPEIAKLNGLRDPRSIRPGQVLRLP